MGEFPSYRKPPVVEVACGLQYTPIPEMHSVHLGRYWTLIEREFPLVEEKPPAPPIALGEGAGPRPEVSRPLSERFLWPRTWFLQQDGRRLIQVQRDRFIYNWRKLTREDPYPRYSTISAEFLGHWETFRAFIRSLGFPLPTPDLCELTYVNVIPRGEGWTALADALELFAFVTQLRDAKFLPAPRELRHGLQFDMPANAGWLQVDLGTARWEATKDLPILRLNLTARGRPPSAVSNDSVKSWFDLAHEWIVKGFVDLVERKTDKLWERQA